VSRNALAAGKNTANNRRLAPCCSQEPTYPDSLPGDDNEKVFENGYMSTLDNTVDLKDFPKHVRYYSKLCSQ